MERPSSRNRAARTWRQRSTDWPPAASGPASGPWTWDQLGPAGIVNADWLRLDTAGCVRRLEEGIETVRAARNLRIHDAVTIEGVGTCSDELKVAAARLAEEADSLCVLHKATSEQEVAREIEVTGHRPVEHMYEIGALNSHVLLNHMTSLENFEVDMLAETGARISQNPSSALKLAKGTTQTGKWPELVKADVPIALGTDADNASNHHDICRSMYLAALLPRDARRDPNAISAEQAVEMATIGGAKALRLDDSLGSIEIGKGSGHSHLRHRRLRLAAAVQPGRQPRVRRDRAYGRYRHRRRRPARRGKAAGSYRRGQGAPGRRNRHPSDLRRDGRYPPARLGRFCSS